MSRYLASLAFSLMPLGWVGVASAQEDSGAWWNGDWLAEGTLFQVRVRVEGDVLILSQVESMGFVWSSQQGRVEGNVMQVEVAYAGVTGIIQAELVDATTAVVFAASCLPEFMVVCALARDRQAVFRKVAAD